MQLWSDEVDAMRAEARAAVDANLPAIVEMLHRDDASADRDARVAASREAMASVYLRSDAVVHREIAGVPCHLFLPDAPARAVYLHFHGGGMVVGAPDMNHLPNEALARDHGVAVVSVDYRLAPEHPYPAGPDDGVAVAAWLLEHSERELGSSRMLIGGESAGGYMTAAVALRIRDELGAIDRVDGLNLVFGVLDWGGPPSQRGVRPASGPDLLDPDGIRFFTECYLPDRTDAERRDPAISPAWADLRDLPPCLVSVGTRDHLLDDSLVFAVRAAAAGVDVELLVLPEMPHGFMAFGCAMTTWWNQRVDEWFRDRLTKAGG